MHSERVIAFFGADLQDREPCVLHDMWKKGHTLLPLDSDALAESEAQGLPYTLMEDWLGYRGIADAWRNAETFHYDWFEQVRDEFTHEGICWPELAAAKLIHFWREVTVADALANAFRANGLKELMFAQPEALSGASLGGTRIAKALWRHRLSDIMAPWPETARKTNGRGTSPLYRGIGRVLQWGRRVSGHLARAPRLLRMNSRPNQEALAAFPDGCILVAVGQSEWGRFKNLVERLGTKFPGRVVVMLAGARPDNASKIEMHTSLSQVFAPEPGPDARLQGKFLAAFNKALKIDGTPWKSALECFRSYFEYQCREVWAKLPHQFEYWRARFREARPIVQILGGGYQEVMVLAAAGSQEGIPSLALPHSTMEGGSRNVRMTDYTLYTISTQRITYERQGILPERILPCKGLYTENEFPVVSDVRLGDTRKWRILALTDATGMASLCYKFNTLRSQFTALRALAGPPSDLEGKLFLRIKCHPTMPDAGIFKAAGAHVWEKVIQPVNTDLRVALEWADLVVAVNCFGSAMLHAIRAGRGVISLFTDNESFTKQAYSYYDLCMEAITVTRTAEEFWSLVRAFFTDETVARMMREKARQFAAKNLDGSNHPELHEIVARFDHNRDGNYDLQPSSVATHHMG